MRCVASWSGLRSASRLRISSTSDQPTVYSDATSSMSRLPGLVARRQRLGEQVRQQEHLDASLAHPSDELVVLVLRPLDPQHVVEQQVVVVRRRQALQAEVRAVDHHLAQLADLGMHTELAHRSSFTDTTLVPARPSTICSMSARAPIAARFPVASTNRAAASTFGPIDPAAKSRWRSSPGVT